MFLRVRPLCPSTRTGRQEVEAITCVVREMGFEHTEWVSFALNQKEQGPAVEKQEARAVGRGTSFLRVFRSEAPTVCNVYAGWS